MRLSKAAIACWMSFSAISCAPTVVAEAIRPDLTNPERFDCATLGTRPAIPGEDPVDLDRIAAAGAQAVAVAREEVAAYVASVRAREGVVARYVVAVEGRLFECANDAQWTREFFSRLPAPE